MACVLDTSDPMTLKGATGSTVKVKVDSDSGGALITAINYGGDNIGAPATNTDPWSFKIKAGLNILDITVDDPVPGDPVRIQEVCPDGTTSILLGFNFDPQAPTQAFRIRGV